MVVTSPLLVLTPHSSGHVPQDVLAAMLGEQRDDGDARERLLRRIFLQGDPYTDAIFDLSAATVLHATASRFVVDLNRARDDARANGVVKVTDFDTAPLYQPGWEPDAAEIAERLLRYWDPFNATATRLIAERQVELILVGHSMSGAGPALGPDSGALRPAITLMTGGNADGERSAAAHLAEQPGEQPAGQPSLAPPLAREFRRLAEESLAAILQAASAQVEPAVVLNRPWSKDELSFRHGLPNAVPAFGLEVNRDLYLDEATGRSLPGRVQALRQALGAFARAALKATRQHASETGTQTERTT